MDSFFWIVFGVIALPFALLGLLLCGIGVYIFFQRWWLMLLGERATARVVALLKSKSSSDAEPELVDLAGPKPFLRLVFTDSSGLERKVSSDTGVSPRKFQPGDEVPILYREGAHKTFVVDRFWMKWAAPLWLTFFGVSLLIPGLAALGGLWPAFGKWVAALGKQSPAWALPLLFDGLAAIFVLIGIDLLRRRWRHWRFSVRTRGRITEAGSRRSGDDRYYWIRVAYADAEGCERTRTLAVSNRRREGEPVPLLVDPAHPEDVLVNEPFEMWFLPGMFLGIGTIVLVVLTWAWLTGKFQ